MKKFITKVAVFMVVAVMAITSAFADDFNWVQWYEWNGMASVTGAIRNGEMTSFEACEKIIVPAYEAGVVEQGQIDYLIDKYPETEQYLIIKGVPVGGGDTPTPTAEPAPVPSYTIEDCDMYKYATTDVNVRTEPDTNAGRVGSVPQNAQVHVTGQTSNGWYRIEYDGINGFSVAKYFADKPIEVIEEVTDVPEPTPAPTAEPTPEPTEEPVTEPTATEVPEATEAPVATEAPATEPTVEPTAEPESITKTEIIEQATPAPTEAPVAEPTTVPATTPVEEESNFHFGMWLMCAGGVALVAVIAFHNYIFEFFRNKFGKKDKK